MKTSPEEEGETPFAPTSPRTANQQEREAKLPAKQIKLTRLVPEGVNQHDVDAVLKRLALMRKRLREDILFVGGRLYKMRNDIRYGNWTRFVENNFPLSVKSANIWIRAYENKDCDLAVNDWDAYMRALYGNEQRNSRQRAVNGAMKRMERIKTMSWIPPNTAGPVLRIPTRIRRINSNRLSGNLLD